ncbi:MULTISPECIES: Imm21 family immunity protein [unclassified Streptomyces]|uniref:Imm21 family immunity protein n=1 Tax=unclassified Streptomyces TaxID=2593676 RepID=UPI002E7AA0D2|nr:Imm21 family immunity protein [Streptomyces sp. JV184]MEE1745535.1 Imm21 family immunity protein [Streptomyces sp. JV184]
MGISHDSNRCDRAGPVWVPSEDELFTAVEAVLLDPDTAWEDGGLWVTDGPAVLMDSAEAGADLGVEYPDGGRPGQAPAQLPAGRWRVRAVHRAEEFPWVGVVQLVPRGRPGRQRNGRLVWGIQLSGAGSTARQGLFRRSESLPGRLLGRVGRTDMAQGGHAASSGSGPARRGALDTKIEHPFSWDSGRVFPGPTVELSTGREDVEAHCQWQGLASLT